jgi:beta-lactamase class A
MDSASIDSKPTRKTIMASRRSILKGLAGTAAIAPLATAWATAQTSASDPKTLAPRILALFDALPGDKAVSILAPATSGRPELSVTMNAGQQLFVGSAIKTFILAEALRQADSPGVVATLTAKQLTLDASVWNLDSATFNPPNLIGQVSERTTLEAMIEHSDNTATDMLLKLVGPDNVRSLIATAQLKNTAIPDSLRGFFGYLLNAKNYQTFSWAASARRQTAPLSTRRSTRRRPSPLRPRTLSPTTPALSRANSSRTTPPSTNTAESFPPATPSGSRPCR